MTFNDEERATLAELADVLIPAGDGFPSASEAGVAQEGLDYVINCRPELLTGIRGLLAAEQGQVWAENRPEGGAQFTMTVPAETQTVIASPVSP